MYFSIQCWGKGMTSLFLIVLFFSLPQTIKAQKFSRKYNEIISGSLSNQDSIRTRKVAYNSFSICLDGSFLPKADIRTKEGTYNLNSKLNSNYGIGVNYTIRKRTPLAISSGLHMNVLLSNFHLHIPDQDLNGYISSNGFPQIEITEAYLRLALSFRVIHDFRKDDRNILSINAGANLNYTGFFVDRSIGVFLADTNYQFTKIFSGDFKSNNRGKPWLSYVLGASKVFNLTNSDKLKIQLFGELSTTPFLNGDYQITVPNKPITIGMYSITGSCMGLSVEYVFTGYNRRFVKQLIKKGKPRQNE